MKTKSDRVIGIKPKQKLADRFYHYVNALQVSQSDLGEEALELALDQAAENIKAKKLKETQSMLERLSGPLLRIASRRVVNA
jgi:hypothetical protein